MDNSKSLACHETKGYDTSAYQTYNAYTEHLHIFDALYFKQSAWSSFGKTFWNLNIDNTGQVTFQYICSYQQFLLFALKIMEDIFT